MAAVTGDAIAFSIFPVKNCHRVEAGPKALHPVGRAGPKGADVAATLREAAPPAAAKEDRASRYWQPTTGNCRSERRPAAGHLHRTQLPPLPIEGEGRGEGCSDHRR